MVTSVQGLFGMLLAVAIGYLYWGTNSPPSIITETIRGEYDYIVIGAGTAGSVVAARLSEDKDKTVLLIEAGDHYNTNPAFMTPLFAFHAIGTRYDWGYRIEPQKFFHQGSIDNTEPFPGGKVLGGSNCLLYVRGSKNDYNNWDANGCTGWSYKDVLPYFLKSEDIQINELKSSKYHHEGGPIAVSNGIVTKIGELILKAGQEAGYNIIDYNGAEEGVGMAQLNTRKGLRSSSSIEFLDKTAERENLDITINTLATKIAIENERATGVTVVKNLRKYFIKARKEVVLSAGTVASPQLLMLSGIGPKNHLKDTGIALKAELPVGMNLQTHLIIPLFVKINSSYGITLDNAKSIVTTVKYKLFGTGPLSSTSVEATGFFYTKGTERGHIFPDIQMIYWTSLPHSNTFFNFKQDLARELISEDPNENGFWTTISVTHPKSTGTVKLKTKDPQYMSNNDDVVRMVAGIRIWEKLMETPTMKRLGVQIEQTKVSMCAQHEFRSDAYWECYIKSVTAHAYHPTGTCKMGAASDPSAVVDPNLRVKGIKGLRVVDGSVIPNITTGNTNAPIMMIAEKISDNIRGIDSVKDLRDRF